jgi:lipid II:glycine glycyltransferase (peptidoglycan interpeptide bridge formation enzyme)
MNVFFHLAWHEGEVVAGHIGSFAGDAAVYVLGATTKRGRELCASYLLQWCVIEYAKSNGNRFYDLGGYDEIANPGVYDFKSRLNGRRVIAAGALEVAPNRFVSSIVKFLEFLRTWSFVKIILSVFRRT